MTDTKTIMRRTDRHAHDPAQIHLTEYDRDNPQSLANRSPTTRVGHVREALPEAMDRDKTYAGRGDDFAHMNNTPIGERGWLGNPYPVCDDRDRGEAITAFADDFEARLADDDDFRSAVADLAGSVLLCWCQKYDDTTPACHAEVIARRADQLRRSGGAP